MRGRLRKVIPIEGQESFEGFLVAATEDFVTPLSKAYFRKKAQIYKEWFEQKNSHTFRPREITNDNPLLEIDLRELEKAQQLSRPKTYRSSIGASKRRDANRFKTYTAWQKGEEPLFLPPKPTLEPSL